MNDCQQNNGQPTATDKNIGTRLPVYIFSYNRVDFLRNCVESILRNVTNPLITIIDDNSTDTDTAQYLKSLPNGVRVRQPNHKENARHGGLYANMQLALETAGSDLAAEPSAQLSEFALFLQDDMQVVRAIANDDWQNIHGFFQHYPRAAVLNPLFLKGARYRRDRRITQHAADYPVYFRNYPEKKNPRGISYADAALFHVPRLVQANWQFVEGETNNAKRAEALFGKMGFMLHPFAMFLPEVPVYRGKSKTRAVRRAEALGGTAPNRFNQMSEHEVSELKERNVAIKLPVAERYLRTERPVKLPFRYSQINVYPILRVIHKIEQALHS